MTTRSPTTIALLAALAIVVWAGTPAAHAAAPCVRAGERVIVSGPRLVMVAPSKRSGRASSVRIVCRRDSRARRTLVSVATACSKCASGIAHEAVRGRFAYAVVSHRSFNDQGSDLVRLDSATWQVRRASLQLGDQGEFTRSDVSDLIPAPRGRVILRVHNDFAAGIVLGGPNGAAYIDEGLATAIGRPRLRGARAVWRHGAAVRSSPTLPADRCPRAPPPGSAIGPAGDFLPGQGRVLGTGDAVTAGTWYCVRATGETGRLDGAVVRLLGFLAVVQRPDDVRVVDLRSRTTLSGPALSDERVRSGPTVGISGTLVLRRFLATAGEAELVALAAGMPERQIARGDLRDVRYEDGVLRYRDHTTNRTFTQPLS